MVDEDSVQPASMVVFLAAAAAWEGRSLFTLNFHSYSNPPLLPQSQEVQFFGAVTLHSKLLKFWNEVPKENYEELKQKLLETIVTFANGPKIVLNRLCIAVSRISEKI